MAKRQQQKSKTSMTAEEAKGMILSIIIDKLEHDVEAAFEYLDHCGFDAGALSKPEDLPDAWVAHYRGRRGVYDVDRALLDYMTWPPLARAIFERQMAQPVGNSKSPVRG